MFRKNCSRNSFLTKTCKQIPRNSLENTMNEVFFNKLTTAANEDQMQAVQEFKNYEGSVQIGYDDIGYQTLVSLQNCFSEINAITKPSLQIDNLSSNKISLLAKSLSLLTDELMNPIKAVKALECNLLQILTDLLSDLRNYVHNDVMQNSLQLLQVLSKSVEASLDIASNKTLMDVVMNLIFDKELSLPSARVLFSISSNATGKTCSFSLFTYISN